MLKLVKDFKDYQFIYYWVDNKGNKQSPNLPTLHHAEDWFLNHKFSEYVGPERRQRTIDRRKDEETSSYTEETNLSYLRRRKQIGRRNTDQDIQIDVDLSAAKIRELKQA